MHQHLKDAKDFFLNLSYSNEQVDIISLFFKVKDFNVLANIKRMVFLKQNYLLM